MSVVSVVSVAVDIASFSAEIAAGRLRPIDIPRAARDVGARGLLCPAAVFLALPAAFGAEMDRAAVCWAGVCAPEEGALSLGGGAPLSWVAPLARACGEAGVPALVVRAAAPPGMAAYNATGAALGRAALLCSEWGARLCLATGDGAPGTAGTAGTAEAAGPGIGSALSWSREVGRLRLLVDLGPLDALPDEAARLAALGPLAPRARLARLGLRGAPGEAGRAASWAAALARLRFCGALVLRAGPGPGAGAGTPDVYTVLGDAALAARKGAPAA